MSWRAEQSELRGAQADHLAERLSRQERVLIQGGPGTGKSALVRAIAARLGNRAVVVTVSTDLDKVQSALLSAAQQLGTAALEEVDRLLSLSGGEPSSALHALTARLDNSLLIVDDTDHLRWPHSSDDASLAFEPHAKAFRQWIKRRASLMTFEQPGRRFEPLADIGDAQPYRLRNGADLDVRELWEHSDRNPLRFRLGLTFALLTESRDALKRKPKGINLLMSDAWAAMPLPLQEFVAAVAVHGRQVPGSLLPELLPDLAESTLSEARRVLLIDENADELALPSPWVQWIQSSAPPTIRSQLHRRLAEAFEQGAAANPVFALEAHRHFLACGDADRARALCRFGPALMLGHARELSIAERHAESARIYEFVLQMDDTLRQEHNSAGIGTRPRAYATHYLHYNRAKARLESPRATERGYRLSLCDWPKNALFWSRLVIARFLLGDLTGAVAALNEATRIVPEHPEKRLLLVTRTISRLLRYSRVQEAISVWGGREAQGPYERTVLESLLARSRLGWTTTKLHGAEDSGVFHRPITATVSRVAPGFACSLVELDITGQGRSPIAAIDAALRGLKQEIAALLSEYTHNLSSEQKLRKRNLLSWVDIVHSGIATTPRHSAWFLGHIEERTGQLVLVTGREAIQVPPELGAVPGDALYLARAPALITGEPDGPVEALERISPDDPSRIWDEWASLASKT